MRRTKHPARATVNHLGMTAAGALAFAIMAYGRTAWADPNVIAVYVEGTQAEAVRNELAAALPEGTTAADASRFERALVDQGQATPFKQKLDGGSHAGSVKKLRDAASASGSKAVLVGRVTKEKSGLRVRLLVVDAAGGERAQGDMVLDLKGGSHDDDEVAASVGSALAKYKTAAPAAKESENAAPAARAPAPPAPPASGQSAESADAAETTTPRPAGIVARSLVDVELGWEAAGRDFEYNDGITGNLRSYSVLPAAMFTVNADLFPLAGASGVLRDIGVVGRFSRSLFLDSSVSGGSNISTSETSYAVGLRVRIHPGGDNGPIIGVSDAYASQAFDFAVTGAPLATEVPSVDYSANRTAVDVRIPAGPFAVLAEVGFRAVVSAGPVAARFRGPSVEGIDAQLGASFAVARGWEVRGALDYERYFYSFSPVPGDTYVAGGALDQLFGARLALAWIY